MDTVFNTIGIIGMLLFLGAYFFLQRGMFSAYDPRYLWMNLIGSIAVLASLVQAWNLPCFLLESAWAVISTHSLIKLRWKKA